MSVLLESAVLGHLCRAHMLYLDILLRTNYNLYLLYGSHQIQERNVYLIDA